MSEYDNNLRGALFRNEEKDDGNPNWPDYKGQAEIARVEYWVSAWIKTSKAGKKFMSLSFKPKLAGEVKGGAKAPPAKPPEPDFNDDIPF